ncbi:MASE1 domain-containing protein [Candidatus Pacearchaeota archaeon]|nr:MASE1 domain-containing protein [Candidatus Pacearchaeota archaeon]
MKSKKRGYKEVGVFLLKLLIFTIIYFIAGKFGLSLAFEHVSASPVWPPTGIAIAMILLYGYRFWPVIFIGAFFVNLTTAGTIITSLGIATGNTIEGLFAAFLINKYLGGKKVFDKPVKIFLFLIVVILSGIISATIGVSTLSLGDFANWSNYIIIWLTWWIGDVIGALVFTPLIILLHKPIKISKIKIFEVILIMLSIVIIGILVFTPLSPFAIHNFPLPFLCVLPILWASIRLGQKGAILSILIISAIAIYGTLNGYGPFVMISLSLNGSLLTLQTYLGFMSLMALFVSSALENK